MSEAPEQAAPTTYDLLIAKFEQTHFRDGGGNTRLEYIDGEQCISRLNEALGVAFWSFRIVADGIHAEADECWAMGELTATIDGRDCVRQQYGSQKIKRSRTSGTPLDIGFDLKGAATDALKKCATLIGVALYLYEKDGTPAAADAGAPLAPKGRAPVAELTCHDCGAEILGGQFPDGRTFTPSQAAGWGVKKYGRSLCSEHYRDAKRADERAKAATQDAEAF